MNWLIAFALAVILNPGLELRDVDGHARRPLQVSTGHLQTIFFVAQDCPISNYYSREIRRVCEQYAPRGVGCTLVYVDPTLTGQQARQHAEEYGHGAYPKIVDRKHELVAATGATVTPEAVVVAPDGNIVYRGRIDNRYMALGKSRQQVTEHDLRNALDEALSGRVASKPESTVVGCYIPELKAFKR